jgi:predicted RNA-binding Zn ribbon-like protein
MAVVSRREREKTLATLPRRGGRPSLDFVNTVDPREGARTRDFLGDYDDLAVWAAQAGVLDPSVSRRLAERAAAVPAEAASVFGRAHELREALYRLLRAIVAGEEPLPEDLQRLHGELHAASAHLVLRRQGAAFSWSWGEDLALERPLWTIVRDACELLTSSDLARVKLCPGRDCGWLFLDASKNRSRRWCSMEICGSRDKMRRLHARRRASPR